MTTTAQVAQGAATVAINQYQAMVENTSYEEHEIKHSVNGGPEVTDKWQLIKATFYSGMTVNYYLREAKYAKSDDVVNGEVELEVIMFDPDGDEMQRDVFTGIKDAVQDAALMWVVDEAAYWSYIFSQRPRKNPNAGTYVRTSDVVVYTAPSRLVGILARGDSMKTRPHGMRG